jgi:hypothetical protein
VTTVAGARAADGLVRGRLGHDRRRSAGDGQLAVALFALLAWSIKVYDDPSQSYVELTPPIVDLRRGGVLFIVAAAVVGLLWMFSCELFTNRAFFRKRDDERRHVADR